MRRSDLKLLKEEARKYIAARDAVTIAIAEQRYESQETERLRREAAASESLLASLTAIVCLSTGELSSPAYLAASAQIRSRVEARAAARVGAPA